MPFIDEFTEAANEHFKLRTDVSKEVRNPNTIRQELLRLTGKNDEPKGFEARLSADDA